MNSKQILLCAVFLVMCLGLALYATPALARDGVYSDPASGSKAAADAPVLPVLQPALAAPVLPRNFGSCSSGFSGVSGDGSLLKIHSGYFTQPVIYMQCGRVVAKVAGAGCGCQAGGWRYVNDCVKSAPIYINLPCPRK